MESVAVCTCKCLMCSTICWQIYRRDIHQVDIHSESVEKLASRAVEKRQLRQFFTSQPKLVVQCSRGVTLFLFSGISMEYFAAKHCIHRRMLVNQCRQMLPINKFVGRRCETSKHVPAPILYKLIFLFSQR